MIDYPELIFLKEPKLTFGFKQKMEDPRDGLTLFGAYSRNKLSGQISVGIIGPKDQRQFLKNYLERIHRPVKCSVAEVARPYFPGLQAAFDVYINFSALQEIDIPIDEIKKYLNYTDGHVRNHNLTKLYADKLIKYQNEEHTPVVVWFVILPDEIYTFGRPKSKIPKSAENIKDGLAKKDRSSDVEFLFDDMNELKEAYDYEINFHNQLKAKLLQEKIVTQLILESTIAYDRIWDKEHRIENEKKFDSAKAWNIATTLYYKVGGIPWKLGEVRKNVCYLGLVYKKMEFDESSSNACCAAQMFLDSGDGMVFRGNIGPWFNPVSKEFHISQTDANSLLSQSLEAFRDKSETKEYPSQVFIHAKTYFDDDEWLGFSEAAEGKSQIVGVRIRDDGGFKLFREFSYCIPRGTVLLINDTTAYMWTKGFIPRLKTQIGLETPNSISVEVTRGSEKIDAVCKDILALTKLNYNACVFGDGSPVTLKFANSIGEILTAGKNVESDVLPFKHYL